MIKSKIFRIDGIKWWLTKDSVGRRTPMPLCPIHDLRMSPTAPLRRQSWEAMELKCAEGPHKINIPRTFEEEKNYVINRIDAKIFKNMEVINLDDEAVPVAESKAKDKKNKYFVASRLMESKRGIQLVVYAGKRGKSEKTQIFIEPEVKRIDFDRNNLHPNEVFVKVKAIFKDGSSYSINGDKT